MTMGPEPIIRIFFKSSRRGTVGSSGGPRSGTGQVRHCGGRRFLLRVVKQRPDAVWGRRQPVDYGRRAVQGKTTRTGLNARKTAAAYQSREEIQAIGLNREIDRFTGAPRSCFPTSPSAGWKAFDCPGNGPFRQRCDLPRPPAAAAPAAVRPRVRWRPYCGFAHGARQAPSGHVPGPPAD